MKYVIEEIKKITGKRHVRFSDEAVQGYPEGIISLMLTVAEIGYRAGMKAEKAKLAGANSRASCLKNQVAEYKALYESELGKKETKAERERKLKEIRDSGAADPVVYTAEEFHRVRQQCQHLLAKNKELKQMYTNLRNRVLDRGYFR